MLDQELREAGFEVAGPFGTCAAILAWLNAETPDAGILDIELSDGPCLEVARKLKERRVPFMVLTGYPSSAAHEEAFSGVPWLEKPMTQEEVLEALKGLFATELNDVNAADLCGQVRSM
jgi:DNA-binding response OmpR family regulator